MLSRWRLPTCTAKELCRTRICFHFSWSQIYSHGVFVVMRLILLTLSAQDKTEISHSKLSRFLSLAYSVDTIATVFIYFVPKFVAPNQPTRRRVGLHFGNGAPRTFSRFLAQFSTVVGNRSSVVASAVEAPNDDGHHHEHTSMSDNANDAKNNSGEEENGITSKPMANKEQARDESTDQEKSLVDVDLSKTSFGEANCLGSESKTSRRVVDYKADSDDDEDDGFRDNSAVGRLRYLENELDDVLEESVLSFPSSLPYSPPTRLCTVCGGKLYCEFVCLNCGESTGDTKTKTMAGSSIPSSDHGFKNGGTGVGDDKDALAINVGRNAILPLVEKSFGGENEADTKARVHISGKCEKSTSPGAINMHVDDDKDGEFQLIQC